MRKKKALLSLNMRIRIFPRQNGFESTSPEIAENDEKT